MNLSILLPFIIIPSGIFLCFKERFFFINHPIRTLKFTIEGKNTKEALGSLSLALAGTLGVGNIVGVTVGLSAGGVGSIFWLFASSVFSSAIKYAEVKLSSSVGDRGMIGVINRSFKRMGSIISRIYAMTCLLLSLFMGAGIQANAIFDSSAEALDLSPAPLAAMLAVILVLLLFGGRSVIKRAASFIIPIAAILYSIGCAAVIIPNLQRLPSLIAEILSQAFSLKSFAAGALTFLSASGMREGFARGLLSNEAGAGTSSFSHDALAPTDADRAGCFGILEVLFDTAILCPMTAFSILLGNESRDFSGSLSSLSDVFLSALGKSGPILLFFCVLAFAFSTVICWYYYGSICREYLFGKRLRLVYPCLYIFFFVFSYRIGNRSLIPAADTSLLILTLISTAATLKNTVKSRSIAPDRL